MSQKTRFLNVRMKVKLLQEVKTEYHCLKKGEILNLPYKVSEKDTGKVLNVEHNVKTNPTTKQQEFVLGVYSGIRDTGYRFFLERNVKWEYTNEVALKPSEQMSLFF